MVKRSTRAILLTTLLLLAVPGAAQARLWGGMGANDLGPASALIDATNGQVKLQNVQLVMSCRDQEDGTYSDRAFYARFPNRVSLRRNRFAFRFAALAGGRLGDVHIDGILRSNGTGSMRVRVEAAAQGDRGATVERCGAAVQITLRRGR